MVLIVKSILHTITNLVSFIYRVPTVLQRKSTGNVQEGYELARNAELPSRSAHQWGGPWRNHPILLRIRPPSRLQRSWHRRSPINDSVLPWRRLGTHQRTSGCHTCSGQVYRRHVQLRWLPGCQAWNTLVYDKDDRCIAFAAFY